MRAMSSNSPHSEPQAVPLAAGTGEQQVSALLRTRVAEDLPELFENLPDAVILIDRDWRLIYANRASRKVSRILPEYFGQSLWELYPDLAPELERAYREAMMLREERHLPTFYYEPLGHMVRLADSAGSLRRGGSLPRYDCAAPGRGSARCRGGAASRSAGGIDRRRHLR